LHDLFCRFLQIDFLNIDRRRIRVVHELSVGEMRWIQAITRNEDDARDLGR
jgi:hypothetical protein